MKTAFIITIVTLALVQGAALWLASHGHESAQADAEWQTTPVVYFVD